MPAEEHESSVLTHVAQTYLGPVLDRTYGQYVESLVGKNDGLAKFMGEGSFVHHGQVHLPDQVVMSTFVLLLLVVLIPLLKGKLSLARPGHGQQVLEMIVSSIKGMLHDVIGHHSDRYLNVIGNFAIFIFVGNFMGMLPGLTAPTANINVTFALGLTSFLYYNAQGFRESGVKYLAHFWGPIMWMGPLMLVIEIFSHFFRPVSLAIRLYGNMSGEHILGGVFLNKLLGAPLLIPVPVMALGLFTCLLQSYIFVMLSMVYIAGAVAHDH
ncbi:MAG: F0F1 ATP synthase subunit A [Acidobacteriota bacterium]